MVKSYETLVHSDTRVDVNTGIVAASRLQAAIGSRDYHIDIAEMRVQVGRISEAVRSVVPESMWGAIIEKLSRVHFDADLYSSTATALNHVGPRLRPGCYVVFDEWHGFHGGGADVQEQRAWCVFADRTGIGWTVTGHGFQQWAVRLT